MLVTINKLTKIFSPTQTSFSKTDAPTLALDDVSFEVQMGEVLGVVGESGCGKTTLGRIIARIISPTKGSIKYAKELSRPTADIQMVFQNPYEAFNPRMSIKEALCEPLIVNRLSRDYGTETGIALDVVGLDKTMLCRMPQELSGGQLQRLAIARALITSPKLVICDEPTSSLDLSVQAQIMKLFLKLKTPERSLLFISHNLELVRIISDRIMVMRSGIIIEIANSRALWDNPLHPYTKLLMGKEMDHTQITPRIAQTNRGCLFCGQCANARPLCEQKRPLLNEINPGHWVACFSC